MTKREHLTSTNALTTVDLTFRAPRLNEHIEPPSVWERIPWRVRALLSVPLVVPLLAVSAIQNGEARPRFVLSFTLCLSLTPAVMVGLFVTSFGPRRAFDAFVGFADQAMWALDKIADPK